jgi:hypothetical protein
MALDESGSNETVGRIFGGYGIQAKDVEVKVAGVEVHVPIRAVPPKIAVYNTHQAE